MNQVYLDTARLLTQVAPGVFQSGDFALKGGTAVSLFVRDMPEKANPAEKLTCLRITKKDRPTVDPFTIYEAEQIIAALHADWGEAIGNYDEFRFFTGLGPCERIALLVSDVRLMTNVLSGPLHSPKSGIDLAPERNPIDVSL